MNGLKHNIIFLPSFFDNRESRWSCNYKNGTPVNKTTLEDVLEMCSKMKDSGEKHRDGAIFAYYEDVTGAASGTDVKSTNVAFFDIDGLTNDKADEIYNTFDELRNWFPYLIAIQYSSGRFVPNPAHGAGLHLYVQIPEGLSVEQYKFESVNIEVILKHILKRHFNIDVTFDTSLRAMGQRFYLYYSPYKYNNETLSTFKTSYMLEEDKEMFSRMYKGEFHSEMLVQDEVKEVKPKGEMWTGDYNKNIDDIDALHYRDRFFVFLTLKNEGVPLQKAYELIEQRLYNPNSGHGIKSWKEQCKSIYKSNSTLHTTKGYKMLERYGVFFVYKTPSTKILIDDGKYMSDYMNTIVGFIEHHHRSAIVAPTGTGKTSLINGNKKVKGLAARLNAVTVVPFNATNKLYDNLYEVSTDTGNEYDDSKNIVLVVDQALRHFKQIKDKTIIIDEAHVLFSDRTYREVMEKFIDRLNEENCKVVLITATPTGEVDMFHCDTLEFFKHRRTVNLEIVETNNPDYTLMNYIHYGMRCFDKVVVFSNSYVRKIYENLIADAMYVGQIAYIRSDTKHTDDYQYLVNEEVLNKKLTLCTSVAYNGLNFKNENEEILVINTFKPGETLYSEIVQSAGRIRKSNVIVKTIVEKESEGDSEEEKTKRAEVYNSISEKENLDSRVFDGLYDKSLLTADVAKARISVEKYCSEHSSIEELMKRLNETGYFVVGQKSVKLQQMKDGKQKEFNARLRLKIKKQQSDEFIDDVMKGEMNGCGSYYVEWLHKLQSLIENYNGVTVEMFKDMLSVGKKDKLVETTLDNLNRICRVCAVEEDDWLHYLNTVDKVANELEKSKIVDTKKFFSSVKENQKIRKKYSPLIYCKNEVLCFDEVFEKIYEEMKEDYGEYLEKCSEGGKKGKRTEAITLKDNYGNVYSFDSKKECMEFLGCVQSTFSSFLNGKSKLNKKYYIVDNQ